MFTREVLDGNKDKRDIQKSFHHERSMIPNNTPYFRHKQWLRRQLQC